MIAKQKSIDTLSADFTQTRSLKTLRVPLISNGKLWIRSREYFRWELGSPPKTIVLGTPTETTVIKPFKKEVLKSQLSSSHGSLDSSEAFGIMSLPGNGNFDDFQKEIKVLGIKTSGTRCHVEFVPRSTELARGLAAITLEFDSETGQWISLEFLTRDGSSIHTDFTNICINPKLDPSLFDYNLSGFKIRDENK
jgi:outer membrane lipoprotein-sorting protein